LLHVSAQTIGFLYFIQDPNAGYFFEDGSSEQLSILSQLGPEVMVVLFKQ
jgi:hypothetical protein